MLNISEKNMCYVMNKIQKGQYMAVGRIPLLKILFFIDVEEKKEETILIGLN